MGHAHPKTFFTVSLKLKCNGIAYIFICHTWQPSRWAGPTCTCTQAPRLVCAKGSATTHPLLCLKAAGRSGPGRVERLLAARDRGKPRFGGRQREQAAEPAARKRRSRGKGLECHPDPAEKEEETRPLHLVLRNVPGKRGCSGGGKEDREGETVWKVVSPSCRAHFLFSWRSKMGGEGRATRPADASSEGPGGGVFRIPGCGAVFGLTRPPSPLSTASLAQDPQRSEKDARWPPRPRPRPRPHHPPATPWEGQLRDKDIWLLSPCRGPGRWAKDTPPQRLGNRHLQEKQDFNLEPDCPGFESQAQPIVASVALVNYFTLGFGFLVS